MPYQMKVMKGHHDQMVRNGITYVINPARAALALTLGRSKLELPDAQIPFMRL